MPPARFLRHSARALVVFATFALAACASVDSRISLPRAEEGAAAPADVPSRASADFWASLLQADVIYIGERHPEARDHDYQFEIIKGLKERGVDFAIGWEMFEFPRQPRLDDWIARRLETAQLLAETDFVKSWGRYSPIYEKMLRWSQLAGISSIALNAPNGMSRKIAQGETLTAAERKLIPEGYVSQSGGLEHFTSQMGAHPGAGIDYAKYYRAQVLWDQTMAERIVQARKRSPRQKIVVFVGRGHVEGGFGIPPYVRQKLPRAGQVILLPGETPIDAGAPPLATSNRPGGGGRM